MSRTNITILAPVYYTSWDKVKYLQESAKYYGIPIHWYGFNKPYTGWYNIQIIDLLEELKKITTPYVLYTDASDALFNTPILEPKISPDQAWIIMSQEHDGGLCAGGWFGPTKYAIEVLELLKNHIPSNTPDVMNPQERWRDAYKNGLIKVSLDTTRSFFQVADESLDVISGLLYNPRTQTFPMLVHWAGGYTDHKTGKAHLIEPYWERLSQH